MTTTDALLKLANWLSPAFPVGAFAYSHGIEQAIATGAVTDAATVTDWIETCLCHGAGRNDAILLVQTMHGGNVDELDELARALCSSKERLLETVSQGTAFAETAAVWGGAATPRAYPVAVGLAALEAQCPERETTALYLQAFASNLVSACIRLVPIGQVEGQRIIAHLQPVIETVTSEALAATLDDLGGCALLSDITSMRHETLDVRLFRS